MVVSSTLRDYSGEILGAGPGIFFHLYKQKETVMDILDDFYHCIHKPLK